MMNYFKLLIISALLFSCQAGTEEDPIQQTDFSKRESAVTDFAAYKHGKTYLPVYSHIYHVHEHRTFDLTSTVSIRNVSMKDSVYLLTADYYNTEGKNIRQYLKNPVYLKPMETIEIIIEEKDSEGGSGANFVFDWAMKSDTNPPLIEAVMISTYGQQGLSFTTRGVRVNE